MPSRWFVFWLTLGLLLPASSTQAQQIPLDPAVRVGRLSNGLRYYIRANPKPEKRAELRLVVNAGSVLEDDDQLGLAHFVEHMAFNGTTHFKKQELVDYIERIGMHFGADLNASTSFDETTYELHIPTDTVAIVSRAFQILEDWAHGVSFDPAAVKKERGVITEEWRLGRGAQARMQNKQFPILFRGSRYATRLPIGTKESLETFGIASLRRFYRDWYRPDLMAVIAVGDFDGAMIERLVRRQFGNIPKATSPRKRVIYPVPDHEAQMATVATDAEATNSSASLVVLRAPEESGTVAAYRRGIVAGLYNQILNARLNEITQKADAPFLFAGSGQGRFVRSREGYSLFTAVKEGGIERGFEALLTEAERIRRFGVTPTELERAKTIYLRQMEQSYAEREKAESDGYVSEYIDHFLTGDPAPGVRYEYELSKTIVPSITVEDVGALIKDRLSPRNRVVLANAPEKAGLAPPTESALLQVFDKVTRQALTAYEDSVSSAPLVSDPPRGSAVVSDKRDTTYDITEWRLGNGVRVLLKPTNFKDDEILMTGWSPGGSSRVPDEQLLSAALATAIVSREGLGTFSAVELQKKLAGKAVRVFPYIGDMQEGFNGQASPKDFTTMFELIYLYFTAPRRDSVAFGAFTDLIRSSLANRGASPDAVFQDSVQVTLANHHPRARPFTADRVGEIHLDQAMTFYRDRFADAGDFTFLFVGNFRLDSIRPLVEQWLGGLPTVTRDDSWKDTGIEPPPGVTERVIRKGIEPKSQTDIIFTGPFEFTPVNRHRLGVLRAVLEIRLREQLREALGGTYGVSVGAESNRIPKSTYTFSVGFGSAPTRAGELTKAVFAEIDSVARFGATPAELAKVKEAELRDHETNLKENQYWLGQVPYSDQNGEPLGEVLGRMLERTNAITSEYVRDAAREYLNRTHYVQLTLCPEQGAACP